MLRKLGLSCFFVSLGSDFDDNTNLTGKGRLLVSILSLKTKRIDKNILEVEERREMVYRSLNLLHRTGAIFSKEFSLQLREGTCFQIANCFRQLVALSAQLSAEKRSEMMICTR